MKNFMFFLSLFFMGSCFAGKDQSPSFFQGLFGGKSQSEQQQVADLKIKIEEAKSILSKKRLSIDIAPRLRGESDLSWLKRVYDQLAYTIEYYKNYRDTEGLI